MGIGFESVRVRELRRLMEGLGDARGSAHGLGRRSPAGGGHPAVIERNSGLLARRPDVCCRAMDGEARHADERLPTLARRDEAALQRPRVADAGSLRDLTFGGTSALVSDSGPNMMMPVVTGAVRAERRRYSRQSSAASTSPGSSSACLHPRHPWTSRRRTSSEIEFPPDEIVQRDAHRFTLTAPDLATCEVNLLDRCIVVRSAVGPDRDEVAHFVADDVLPRIAGPDGRTARCRAGGRWSGVRLPRTERRRVDARGASGARGRPAPG